jgi:hypothetical protein
MRHSVKGEVIKEPLVGRDPLHTYPEKQIEASPVLDAVFVNTARTIASAPNELRPQCFVGKNPAEIEDIARRYCRVLPPEEYKKAVSRISRERNLAKEVTYNALYIDLKSGHALIAFINDYELMYDNIAFCLASLQLPVVRKPRKRTLMNMEGLSESEFDIFAAGVPLTIDNVETVQAGVINFVRNEKRDSLTNVGAVVVKEAFLYAYPAYLACMQYFNNYGYVEKESPERFQEFVDSLTFAKLAIPEKLYLYTIFNAVKNVSELEQLLVDLKVLLNPTSREQIAQGMKILAERQEFFAKLIIDIRATDRLRDIIRDQSTNFSRLLLRYENDPFGQLIAIQLHIQKLSEPYWRKSTHEIMGMLGVTRTVDSALQKESDSVSPYLLLTLFVQSLLSQNDTLQLGMDLIAGIIENNFVQRSGATKKDG